MSFFLRVSAPSISLAGLMFKLLDVAHYSLLHLRLFMALIVTCAIILIHPRAAFCACVEALLMLESLALLLQYHLDSVSDLVIIIYTVVHMT